MEEKVYKSDQDQLRMLVRESSALTDALNKLENQIFSLETQYIQEECPAWNIVKGFEGFQDRSQGINRRPSLLRDERIFSLSSRSSPATNLPVDDDTRSGESSPTHKTKRNRKKKSMYGEDEFE